MALSEMLELMESGGDWQKEIVVPRNRYSDDTTRRMMELWENKAQLPRHKHEYEVHEAMSHSDFPILMATILDRQMLAAYETLEMPPYNNIFRNRAGGITDLKREVYSLDYAGDLAPLQVVAEYGKYLEHPAVAETPYHYHLLKWGAMYRISWEVSLADDLGLIDRLPKRLATGARMTENYVQSNLLATTTGWRAVTIQTGGVSALPLSEANLITALGNMCGDDTAYRSGGWHIVNRPGFLVVSSEALAMTARRILEPESWAVVGTAGAITDRGNLNVLKAYGLTIVFDPMLASLCTTGTIGQTMWGIFSKNIPIAEYSFLRGQNAPYLTMRASDMVTVGGGAVGPGEGSFEDDSIAYRVRHPYNACLCDPRGAWLSNGQ